MHVLSTERFITGKDRMDLPGLWFTDVGRDESASPGKTVGIPTLRGCHQFPYVISSSQITDMTQSNP